MLKTPIGRLRLIAILEAISFLVLLGIAMPLKYWAGIENAVKYVGWAHGVLFLLFCAALLYAMQTTTLRFWKAALVFVAALLPFGPFFVDHKLKDEELAGAK
jgi:integral membrane protein